MRGVSRKRALLLLSIVIGVAGAVAPAIAASAQESGSVAIRLLEGPSSRADDPRASQYIVDHVEPGTRITRRFELSNRTDGPTELQLYDAAATVDDGSFQFADGRGENELTGWTTVSPPTLSLPAGAKGTGTVTIDVPAGVSGGERYAVVWAELPGAPSPSGITVVNRVGIRIYLSVGGASEPPTSFRLDSFVPTRDESGQPGVTVTACNDGGRAVDLEASLELTEGPGGTSAGPFTSDGATTLAPGDCGDVPVLAPADLPRGPWRARATLRSGLTEKSAEARITFPAAPAGGGAVSGAPVEAEDVTDSTGGRLLILLALLLLLLVLAFLAWLLYRRRKQKREEEAAEAESLEPVG